MPQCSLIISFYNRIDYLALVFASIERQTFADFEVIVADDGSREKIVAEVNEMLKTASLAVRQAVLLVLPKLLTPPDLSRY